MRAGEDWGYGGGFVEIGESGRSYAEEKVKDTVASQP